LSVQYLANCDQGSSGCGGGDTLGAYNFIASHGICTAACVKYYSGTTKDTGACPATCDDKQAIIPQDLYHTVDGHSLIRQDVKATEEAMQREIVENGPISASFLVKQDFLDFFKNNETKYSVYHRYVNKGKIVTLNLT